MAEKKSDIHIVIQETVLKAAKIRCIQEDLVLTSISTVPEISNMTMGALCLAQD